jgi:hypothetical protein
MFNASPCDIELRATRSLEEADAFLAEEEHLAEHLALLGV